MTKRSISFAHVLATTCGSGFFPYAPGTVGSAIALAGLWFIQPVRLYIYIPFLAILYLIGVWAATQAEKAWGHDAGRINWDEVVGMAITVIALPKSFITYGAAFAAFRLFDIWKPFPVDVSQGLRGGWGVMTDDVLAAIYGNAALQVILRIVNIIPAP